MRLETIPATSSSTIVATIVGDVARSGYAEMAMGTPLSQAIEEIGGGPRPGRTFKAAFSGVANAVLTADRFDTPLTYEAMAAAGIGGVEVAFVYPLSASEAERDGGGFLSERHLSRLRFAAETVRERRLPLRPTA